jgi:tRNA G18 (ribose-2'-O)-methylase SpoU
LDAIAGLREQGFAVAAIEQTANSITLLDWNPEPGSKWAFVFGNEVRGVEAETLSACDAALEIPQFGVKQSLNVSVCGGIVLWDAAQKIGLPG